MVDERLITIIVLAICILMLLAAANSGGNKGPIAEMRNPNRLFQPDARQHVNDYARQN